VYASSLDLEDLERILMLLFAPKGQCSVLIFSGLSGDEKNHPLNSEYINSFQKIV